MKQHTETTKAQVLDHRARMMASWNSGRTRPIRQPPLLRLNGRGRTCARFCRRDRVTNRVVKKPSFFRPEPFQHGAVRVIYLYS